MMLGRRFGILRRARFTRAVVTAALVVGALAVPLAGHALTYPTVSQHIPVDANPVGVGVNQATHKVYVAASGANLVDVIDANTNNIVRRIATGALPYGVAVDSTANRVYVTLGNAHAVAVIDGASDTVLTTIALPAGPSFLVVDNPNHRVYVTMAALNSVSVIDTTTNTVTGAIAVGTSPQGIAINLTANRIYVANGGSGTVTVLDRLTSAVVATVPVGVNPQMIAVDTGANRVYVPNFGTTTDATGTVSVINGATNAVIATVTVGKHPVGVAVNGTLHHAYVTTFDGNTTSIIDTGTNAVLTTLTGFVQPMGVDALSDFRTAYVADNQDATLDVVSEIVDTTPPHTTITGGPTGLVNANSASFTFTASDDLASPAHITSECRVDAAPFSSCVSGVTFNSLADGSHTFSVRSTDESGNVEAPAATRSWTIDSTPPDTFITDSPPNPSNSVRGIVKFTGTDNVSATANLRYECRLDNLPNFQPCVSGSELYALLPGPHTYRVRAIDQLGNVDPTPASVTWNVVDTQAPLSSFDTQSTGTLLVNTTNLLVITPVYGFASDDVAGIDHLDVVFVPQPSPLQAIDRQITVRVSGRDLACNDVTETQCRWQAAPSVLPGVYWVYVVATDRSGSSHAVQTVPTPPIVVTVI